jgi:hypothetical protein
MSIFCTVLYVELNKERGGISISPLSEQLPQPHLPMAPVKAGITTEQL